MPSLVLLAASLLLPASSQPSGTPSRRLDAPGVSRTNEPNIAVVRVADGKLLRQTGPAIAPTRPGSTIKPFTLYALLQQTGFDPAKRIACPGKLTIAGRRFDCSHGPAIPAVDASQAIAYSCNHYFAHWSRILNEANLHAALAHFHLTASHAHTPDELTLQALGEWGTEVTPVTLAQAYRLLALDENEPKLAPLFAGLRLATREGTAQLAGSGFAGKTGTAATLSRLSLQAWFAGFTPATHPETVVVVYVPHGRGATSAAPLAREAIR